MPPLQNNHLKKNSLGSPLTFIHRQGSLVEAFWKMAQSVWFVSGFTISSQKKQYEIVSFQYDWKIGDFQILQKNLFECLNFMFTLCRNRSDVANYLVASFWIKVDEFEKCNHWWPRLHSWAVIVQQSWEGLLAPITALHNTGRAHNFHNQQRHHLHHYWSSIIRLAFYWKTGAIIRRMDCMIGNRSWLRRKVEWSLGQDGDIAMRSQLQSKHCIRANRYCYDDAGGHCHHHVCAKLGRCGRIRHWGGLVKHDTIAIFSGLHWLVLICLTRQFKSRP